MKNVNSTLSAGVDENEGILGQNVWNAIWTIETGRAYAPIEGTVISAVRTDDNNVIVEILQFQVIIVPHSHNDPGWLKTFVNYFQSDSRQILNLIITKMQEYTDMTFIWSEISFLQLWWDQAHPTKQRALKKLIQSGRFEVWFYQTAYELTSDFLPKQKSSDHNWWVGYDRRGERSFVRYAGSTNWRSPVG